MSGETVVGSILGYLRLNDDDWRTTIDRAKRDLKDLDSQRVSVPVTADASKAKAAIKETAAAADALDRKDVDVEINATGAAKALSAIEAVSRAENGLRLAQQKSAAAQSAYDRAASAAVPDQQKLADLSQKLTNAREAESLATMRLANVQYSQAASLKKFNDAQDQANAGSVRTRRNVNLLGSALVALGPAAAPLTVAAVALGTAFAGMGATAALAVYGIKQEMKSGTAAGQDYIASIDTLKGDLNQLGHVAASGLLKPFQTVVSDVQGSMPELTKDVGEFASITGGAATSAVHGLLSAVQVANPLFLAGGAAISGMADDFDRFAQSQGFKDFVSYAAANLPQVVDDVEQIAGAAVHLVAAFAPMGMGTLSALRMVAQLLNSLPVEVLQTLATTATGVYLAFQSWKGMSNLLGGVSSAFGGLASRTGSSAAGMIATAAASGGASLAVGGLGLAVGAATIAWGLYQQHQQEVKQTTQDLSQAIQADSGAIGEHTRQILAAKVAQMDGADSLGKYGYTQQQVTDAIASGGPALDALVSKLGEQKSAADAAAKSGDAWAAVGRDRVDETAGGMSDSIANLSKMLREAKAAQDKQRDALLAGKQATLDAADADYNLKLAKLDVATATDDQRKAIDQLNQALDREISKNLQVQGGLTGVAASQQQLVDTLKGSAAVTDLNSKAGVKNRQAIEQTVGQLQSYRDTLAKTSGNTADATKKYQQMGTTLLEQIAKIDGANSATFKYAQSLLALPKDVSTKVGTTGTEVSAKQLLGLGETAKALGETKVQIPAGVPNAKNVATLLNGIGTAALSANNKSVTIKTGAPNAPATQALVQMLGDKVVTVNKNGTVTVKASALTADAVQKIQAIMTMLGQIPRSVSSNISITTTKTTVQRWLDEPSTAGKRSGAMYDGGGYTGSGGKFEPAGIVHRGEVVWSQDDVAAHGGPQAVDRMRRSRAGYASGGIVGYATGGVAEGDFDLADIFSLMSSMQVDGNQLASAKGTVADKRKAVGAATTALNKILVSLSAAQHRLAAARMTKSPKDDIAAAERVNKLLIDRSAAFAKLAAAQRAAGTAQASYNTLAAASKMSTGQLFIKASGQNNAVNQQFLNDLIKIKALGFGVIALQLLNQGDDEAMKTAHSFATGPLAQLAQAKANLQKSGTLQDQFATLKGQLDGSSALAKAQAAAAAIKAQRDANAQTLAMQYAAAQTRYGTTVINHSGGGVTAAQMEAMVSRVVSRMPQGDVYLDGSKVGYKVAKPVSLAQKIRDSYGYTGIYAGQGDY